METVDRWVWKDSDSTEFSVKSAYGFLRGEESEEDLRRYNFFLEIKALPSAQVTTWRVIENKVACRVNLERRGIKIESNLCCLCRRLEETTNHLFCECRVAWLIWNLCYDWLGIRSVDFMDPGSHFEHFKILDAPISVNLIMGNLWITLVSEIWRHMNKGGVVYHIEVFSLVLDLIKDTVN